ncbi:MAG: hypothetical protein LBE38_09925 [Deltaproteobacteria bacterium]|jgi:hypothetical protein|nr:hypothetical protein [Deltaproteobacteria bacterium]
MTRLTSEHLLDGFDERGFSQFLSKQLHTDIFHLTCRAWDLDPKKLASKLKMKKLAAIRISSGEGTITGFAEIVAEAASLMGLLAEVMEAPDDEGFIEAHNWGADILAYSDDWDFVAQTADKSRTIHNNPATSRIYVSSLEFLVGTSLKGLDVLVWGLGPVGLGAAFRLSELKAKVHLYDTDQGALLKGEKLIPGASSIKGEGALLDYLKNYQKPIIFEAVPQEELIGSLSLESLFEGKAPRVAAPGVPLSWPFNWLKGENGSLFHEPLMAGTASMLAGLCVEDYSPQYGKALEIL